MQYKTEIYISEVTNLSDARYAAGMMVNYIGFPLDEKMAKHIDLNTFAAITGWLQGIDIVAEFSSESIEEINQITSSHQPACISLPFSRYQDTPEIHTKVILRAGVNDLSTLLSLELSSQVTFILIEGSDVLSEETLSEITGCRLADRIILEAGVSLDSLPQIANSGLKGICIKGGEEERPGYKSYDDMADLIEALEQ